MKKRLSIIICFVILVSIFVSACGTKREYPDPKVTIDNLLTAFSSGDAEAVSEIAGDEFGYDLSAYDEQTKDVLLYFFDLMTIEINGEPVYKGEQVDLSITATVPDLNAAMAAVIDSDNPEFITLLVKDILLATINGEDTTAAEEEMIGKFFEEMKVKMTDPENHLSTDSTMKMILNEDGDAWIIDSVSEDFIDPASVKINSDELTSAIASVVADAVPGALELLLEEGSIDQATYDAIISAM